MTTPAPAGGDDIPIDVDLIKVLASDTRRDILRLLGQRRHTLSELAEALGLKKATILEHLEKLQASTLVKRIDDGERIWIYYELTRRGKRIVHPERTTRFYLLMAGSAAAVLLLGAIAAAAMMGGFLPEPQRSSSDMAGEALLADDVRAVAPMVVYRGFDDGVPVVIEGAAPPGATLLVDTLELSVQDGRATLDAGAIDALPEGRHALRLRTDAGDLALRAELDVRQPPVSLAPLALPEGRATQVVLSVGAPGMPVPANVTLRIDGEPVALHDMGRERAFTYTPQEPGALRVQVGRLVERELHAYADAEVAASYDNGTLALALHDARGPLGDAAVLLGAAELGTTDANGTLRAPWPPEGEHALRVRTAAGATIERAVVVGSQSIAVAPARLALSAYADPTARTLDALVDVTNAAPTNETVTLVARLDGTPIASARVDVPAGAHAQARLAADVPLTAPVVIEAYAARGLAVQARSFTYESGSGGSYDSASGEPPAAPRPAATTAPENATASRAVNALFAGPRPDATTTLYPTAPTMAPADAAQATPAPAVPFVGPALVVALVALAALLTRGGRAGRR